jgi:dihydrofolate synthase/folylpolyglutamate synthase
MRVGERINLNQGSIDDGTLDRLLGEIREGLPPETHGSFLYSEVLLTASLMWFRENQAQFIVLEAGLGGRLDSVNLFRKPLATAITSVSMEHAAILGPDIPAIAREKAGIVKKCRPMVTGSTDLALSIIETRAERFQAPFLRYNQDFGWQGDTLFLGPRSLVVAQLQETSAGRINRAIGAFLALLAVPELTDSSIREGVLKARLPGRFQVISQSPLVIIDVAHNYEGMANLVSALEENYPTARKAFVLGIFSDKPAEEMVALATQSGQVFYAPPNNPRSFIPKNDLGKARLYPELSLAYQAAVDSGAEVICISGSFATVSELFSQLSG